jgi:hypothetical protein
MQYGVQWSATWVSVVSFFCFKMDQHQVKKLVKPRADARMKPMRKGKLPWGARRRGPLRASENIRPPIRPLLLPRRMVNRFSKQTWLLAWMLAWMLHDCQPAHTSTFSSRPRASFHASGSKPLDLVGRVPPGFLLGTGRV